MADEQTVADRDMLHAVEDVIAQAGYEVLSVDENVLTVRDVDSGIAMQAALEGNVLFLSLVCLTTSPKAMTPEVMRKMLDAENGISTSSFQLYRRDDGNVAVTLNNFCKLQQMGADDQDDILSCLEFLIIDVLAAKQLLAEL